MPASVYSVSALGQSSQWSSSKIFHQENSVRVSCPPHSIDSVASKYKKTDKKRGLFYLGTGILAHYVVYSFRILEAGSTNESEGQFILKWCILFI
jgi:hypothetical protein